MKEDGYKHQVISYFCLNLDTALYSRTRRVGTVANWDFKPSLKVAAAAQFQLTAAFRARRPSAARSSNF